jgi:hypothetical protein
MVTKDDRVRRLAGGTPRYNAALSTQIARDIKAKRHDCQRNALLAVIAGCDVYVEGILHDPQVQEYAPAWMRNGVRHAWCIKDGQLIDPTVNAHVVPEIADIGDIQATSVYQPLAVLTRGEIRRSLALSIDHAWELIDGLVYHVPEGVAGWQGEDVAGVADAVVAEALRTYDQLRRDAPGQGTPRP